jgi:nucleoside-diphosphate-sugar epimerase
MNNLKLLNLDKLKHKRILITGASGFIGSNLVKFLCQTGAEIYGTSRSENTSTIKNFTWLKCSMEDFEAVEQLLIKTKPDIIYHLSGEVTGSTDIKYVQGTFHSLVTSTVNLLTLATKRGCERIILMGSCREPANQLQFPDSPYSVAKSTASAYGNMFWNCYQTPVVTARTFVTYGPGQPSRMLIPYVILSLLNNESPKLSSGKWLTDWIYIDDVIEGMIAATLIPGIEGSTIDLGTGVLTSVKELAENIEKKIDSKGSLLFGALPDRTNEHIRVADTQTAFEKLKWKASTSLDNGLTKTIEALRSSLVRRVLLFGHWLSALILSQL